MAEAPPNEPPTDASGAHTANDEADIVDSVIDRLIEQFGKLKGQRKPNSKAPRNGAQQPRQAARDRVQAWLADQGYPLEMRCARVFHEAGAELVQGEFYPSPEGKSREIDIGAQFGVSWHVLDRPEGGAPQATYMLFDLFVVVECKSGPKSQKPWVVFSSTRNRMNTAMRFQRLGSEIGKTFLFQTASIDKAVQSLDVFQIRTRHGYALSCAHDGSDQAYAALSSLVAAARYKASIQDELFQISRVVLPVLIVDTPLFECWLDDAGNMQLEECDQATLVWHNAISDDPHVIVDILHESALPRYAAQVAEARRVLSTAPRLIAMENIAARIEAKAIATYVGSPGASTLITPEE
jgi:hypothetical protein